MFKKVLIVFNYNICAPFEVTLIFYLPENLQRVGVVGIVLVSRYLADFDSLQGNSPQNHQHHHNHVIFTQDPTMLFCSKPTSPASESY